MATIEERFNAAVNVIKNLPKNGSYQPSTAMMLTFYGYYKQATEGPCQQSKPHFWDVVGKAKWDAWNANRHLTKDRAMELYVEELRKIIETMSYTDNVANFVGSVSELNAVNLDDLEAVSPGIREIAQSHPNSPFSSRTNSPQHGVSANSLSDTAELPESKPVEEAKNQINFGIYKNSPANSDGVLSNTVSYDMDGRPHNFKRKPNSRNNGYVTDDYSGNSLNELKSNTEASEVSEDEEYNDPFDTPMEFTEAVKQNSELLKQVQATVLRMNADIASITQRLNSIEKCVEDMRKFLLVKSNGCITTRNSLELTNRRQRSFPKWWPFDDISPSWFVFLVLWPVLTNRITRILLQRQSK